jgi:putative glycosyltransferase (TIGR04372 family)
MMNSRRETAMKEHKESLLHKILSRLGRRTIWMIPAYLWILFISQLLKKVTGIQIRVVALPSRFGHLALEPDLYLARNDGNSSKSKKIFAYYPVDASSESLLEEWKKIFGRAPQSITKCIYEVETSTGKRHFLEDLLEASIPEEIQILDSAPRRVFKDFDWESKDEFRASLATKSLEDIILLAVRDSNYEKMLNFHTGGEHAIFRNSEISNYLLGIKALNAQGFTVVRMGKSGESLAEYSDSKYIDLCSPDAKSVDLLQFYLADRCKAVIATDTGAINFGMLFRKPIYCLNFVSLSNGFRSNYLKLLMFKKMRDKTSRELLTLEEMFRRGFQNFTHQDQILRSNILLEDNTEQEILEFSFEVREHLAGQWKPTQDSINLKKKFTYFSKRYGIPIPTVEFPNSWAGKSQHLLG